MPILLRKPALPADWPSPWHNKCSYSKCTFPNNPQPAAGKYNCRGCEKGTYFVSQAVAAEVDVRTRRMYRFVDENRENLKLKQEEFERISTERDYERYKKEDEKKRLMKEQQEKQARAVERARQETERRRQEVEARRREEAERQRQEMEARRREEAERQRQEKERRAIELERQRQAMEIRAIESRLQENAAAAARQGRGLYEPQTSPRTEARRAKLAASPEASLGRRGAYRKPSGDGYGRGTVVDSPPRPAPAQQYYDASHQGGAQYRGHPVYRIANQ